MGSIPERKLGEMGLWSTGPFIRRAQLICGGANVTRHNAINPGRKTNDPQNI